MPRYKSKISTQIPSEELAQSIEEYLTSHGFKLIDQDRNTWRKGMGWLLGPQFIEFEVRRGELRLDAWIQFALLPGVFIGEFGIEGFFMAIPKTKLRGCVRDIEDLAG